MSALPSPGAPCARPIPIVLIALLCLGGGSAALAQPEPGVPETQNPVVFLEKSYLSPFNPSGKNLIMEGQASGHYYAHNGLTDREWSRKGGTRFTVPISMVFVVRIFDEDSAPVRTPSFMLRPLYGQMVHLTRAPGEFRMIAVGTGLTHHSNGQAGCTFLGQEPDPNGDGCVTTDASLLAERRANVRDGSFSTNFLPLNVGVRWGDLDGDGVVTRSFSVRARGELHPKQFLKGGISKSQAAQYGQFLLGGGAEWEKTTRKGVVRVDGWVQSRFGPDKDGSDWAGQMEASFVFRRAENTGLFLRWHLGSDYYNIRFQDDRGWVQIGLMWDPGRLDQFQRQRRQRRPSSGGP